MVCSVKVSRLAICAALKKSVQLCSWLLDGSADSHTLDQQPIAQPAFLENTIKAVERLVWEEIVDCFPFENGVWCSRLDRHISPFVEKGSGENFYVGKLLCFHLSFLHHLKHELKSTSLRIQHPWTFLSFCHLFPTILFRLTPWQNYPSCVEEKWPDKWFQKQTVVFSRRHTFVSWSSLFQCAPPSCCSKDRVMK